MKNIIVTIFALCFMVFQVQAQTITTDVPYHTQFDSSYVVGQGMIDSFDINQNFQGFNTGQFVLCENVVFTFIGNQSSSGPAFYLLPGAKLILKDSYFYPTIYMSDMAILDADSGNQNIVCYREAGTTLNNISNVNWITDSVVTSMNFTFMNWPNASSPCAITWPQSNASITLLNAKVYTRNNRLHYLLDKDQASSLTLTDMWGRVLLLTQIESAGEIDLSAYAAGLYVVQIKQNGALYKKKIVIN